MILDVFEAIEAAFIADGITDVTFAVGQRARSFEQSPRRIVIVPTTDTYGPPTYPGRTGNGAGRPLATRHATADVYVWGRDTSITDEALRDRADYRATESLVSQFIRQLHRHAFGSRDLDMSGAWDNETNDVRFGREYVLRISVHVPVTDTPYPLAPSDTTAIQQGNMQFPTSTVPGCS